MGAWGRTGWRSTLGDTAVGELTALGFHESTVGALGGDLARDGGVQRDLVDRWVQHGDRLRTLVPAVIETPRQWIALLRGWELNGETRIGFDPGPDTGPAHIFSLRAILDAALAAFGDDEGEG